MIPPPYRPLLPLLASPREDLGLLIGSAALALVCPRALRVPPADLDLVVPLRAVEPLAARLRARGFTLWSWDEPFTGRAQLPGRFYLRARRGPLVVDLTYEGPGGEDRSPLDYDHAAPRALTRAGARVACLADICLLLRARGRPRDLARVARALSPSAA